MCLKISGKKWIKLILILTAVGCGFGKLTGTISWEQIANAIKSYKDFKCVRANSHVILAEPNLSTQAKIYQNHEFINILN